MEKAESIMNMVKNREEFVKSQVKCSFPNIIAENYYEIIKELSTAILLTEGYKTIGDYAHKELIERIFQKYKIGDEYIFLVNDLRMKRNQSMYEGRKISKDYINFKQEKIENIIQKLKEILIKKLE